ncbi:MAG: PilZ domain-containing protein [Planctomycetota bacterium]
MTPLQDMVPGISEASVYVFRKKAWQVGTFAGFTLSGDFLVNFQSPPEGLVGRTLLAQLAPRKEDPPVMFVSVLEEAPARWKLLKPRTLPVNEPRDPDAPSRRQNFRVSPQDEDFPSILFRPRKAKKNSPGIEAQLIDVSAGGVGLALHEEALQQVHLEDRFFVPLHLGLGLEGGNALHAEDLPCILCNAHPQDRQALLGMRFELESLDEKARERLVARILHYVAARQRRIIQHRQKLRDGNR